MADLAPFPDPHEVLKLALTGLQGLTAGDVEPGDHHKIVGPDLVPYVEKYLPVVQVRVVGGVADKITAAPRLTVLTFAATYTESRDLAYAILQRLLPGGIPTAAGSLDRCEVDGYPSPMPYPNTKVHVHVAGYRPTFRRR